MSQEHKLRFVGRWVGETQGCDSPAHTWEILPPYNGYDGVSMDIKTQWEGEAGTAGLRGRLNEDGRSFEIRGIESHIFVATLLDAEHFVIPGWDTNDMRGKAGPDYDVIFSRPGLAELSAVAVYERWSYSRF